MVDHSPPLALTDLVGGTGGGEPLTSSSFSVSRAVPGHTGQIDSASHSPPFEGFPIMSTIIVIILALIAGPTFNADGTYLVDDRVSGVAMCMDTAIHVSACIDSIMATEFDN